MERNYWERSSIRRSSIVLIWSTMYSYWNARSSFAKLLKVQYLAKSLPTSIRSSFKSVGFHICIFFNFGIWIKNFTPEQIDNVVSSKIPDLICYLELYDLVKRQMIHKPCELLNFNSPCMVSDKNGGVSWACSKQFSKKYSDEPS